MENNDKNISKECLKAHLTILVGDFIDEGTIFTDKFIVKIRCGLLGYFNSI